MIIFAEAQSAPTPAQFGGFWVVVMFMSSIAASVVTVVVAFMSARKQKREITFGFEPASKTEFVKHIEENRREHENLFSKIGGVERGQSARFEEKFASMNREANESREKLHERINQVLQAVSRLEGRVGGKQH